MDNFWKKNNRTSLIAEIGINHGGDFNKAIELIKMSKDAGADYVKFQCRSPRDSTPKAMWDVPKETPWGTVEPYISYREKMEFSNEQFEMIDDYCKNLNIEWFASAWDKSSVAFLSAFDIPFIKIPSAKCDDFELIKYAIASAKRIIVSTGMSTLSDLDHIAYLLPAHRGSGLFVCHSEYPVTDEAEIDLNQIGAYQKDYDWLEIGFSSHSKSPFPVIYAAVLGASMVECHVTLDRSQSWGDNPASLEASGLKLIRRELDRIVLLLGNGKKRLHPSEMKARLKLRGY